MARIAIRFLEPSAQSLTAAAGVSSRPIGIRIGASNRASTGRISEEQRILSMGTPRAQQQSSKMCFFLARTGTVTTHIRHLMWNDSKATIREYRLYSRKKNPKTGKRRNLGTFATREKAEAHERAVQYFKRH